MSGFVAAGYYSSVNDANPFGRSNPPGNMPMAVILDGTAVNMVAAGYKGATASVADRTLVLGSEVDAQVSKATTIVVQYIKKDGTQLALDAAPNVRIFSVDTTTGAQTDELASTAMTVIGSANAWKTTWTPSKAGSYILQVTGVASGAGVTNSWPVVARKFIGLGNTFQKRKTF